MAIVVSVDGVSSSDFSQLAELGVKMERLGKSVSHNSARAMRDEAHKVKNIARMMAPLDKGFLESSIDVKEEHGSNGRIVFKVFADGSVYAPHISRNGEKPFYVGDYLAFIHEAIYKLGPESRAKQAVTPYRVGRKFLERAFMERQDKIVSRIHDAVKRSFGGRYSNFDKYMSLGSEEFDGE